MDGFDQLDDTTGLAPVDVDPQGDPFAAPDDQDDQLVAPDPDPVLDDGAQESGYESVDLDGDGQLDAVVGYLEGIGSFAVLDGDGDGVIDNWQFDTDGDGLVDLTVDPDGNGAFILSADLDHDGVMDQQLTLTPQQIHDNAPELAALLGLETGVEDDPTDPAPADPDNPGQSPVRYPEVNENGQIDGDPFEYSDVWFHQAFNGSCLPASVAQIYNLYTGSHTTDQDFVALANDEGLWSVGPDGIPGLAPGAAVQLLGDVGIDAELQSSDMSGLAAALDDGYSVVAMVDSGEIWTGEAQDGDAEMDHALVVAAVDEDKGIVYLSDTGYADANGDPSGGNMYECPIATFEDAWADSDNAMVVCEQTVEQYQSEHGTADAPADQDGQGQGADVVTQPASADVLPGGDQPLPVWESDLTPTSPLEQALTFVTRHPWIVLPVLLPAAALLRRNADQK